MVGFRDDAGARVAVCIRVAVGLGLDKGAGQHAGEHLGLCRQQGSTLQGGGATGAHTVAPGTSVLSVCTAEKR